MLRCVWTTVTGLYLVQLAMSLKEMHIQVWFKMKIVHSNPLYLAARGQNTVCQSCRNNAGVLEISFVVTLGHHF
jgi:hypothetical protein